MIENEMMTTVIITTWLIVLVGTILNLIISVANRNKITKLDVKVNGRMEELIRTTRIAAAAVGNLAGRSEQTQERTAEKPLVK